MTERATLLNALSTMTPEMRVMFSLLCAERLRVCCWCFERLEDFDCTAFFTVLDEMFARAMKSERQDLKQVDDFMSLLAARTPHSDEYGSELGVQAQNGMIALLSACQQTRTTDPEPAIQASDAVMDALSNYDYFVSQRMSVESGDENADIFDRETRWQMELIGRLRESGGGTPGAIEAIRVANWHRMVPPAVS
jgi:hypothetical protein